MRKIRGQYLKKGDIFKHYFRSNNRKYYQILRIIKKTKFQGIFRCKLLKTNWNVNRANYISTWGLYNCKVYRFNIDEKMAWLI